MSAQLTGSPQLQLEGLQPLDLVPQLGRPLELELGRGLPHLLAQRRHPSRDLGRGDVFGSLRCDCGEQLDKALRLVAEAGRGVVVYMDQEGRGIGLHNKIRAYHLQDGGLDTVEANEALGFPADKREYGIGMQILLDLGIRKMRLMTNNPIKRAGLEGFGLEVVERVPIEVTPNPHNVRYLRTKREKMGHLLDADGLG